MLPSENRADFFNFAFNNRRVPNRRHISPADQSFTLPKQAQLCCVYIQAQYQAFVRFAVESGTTLACAQMTLRFGTFYRRALI
jgi:hypothetical protein